MPLLPGRPTEGQEPWFDDRDAWDQAVETRLEGDLDQGELESKYAHLEGGILVIDGVPVGGSGASRDTRTITTGSLAAGATQVGTVDLGLKFDLVSINTDGAARVRLYSSAAQRNADISRPRGEFPDAQTDAGIILDWALPNATSDPWDLFAQGAVKTGDTLVAYTITNEAVTTAVVEVTIEYQATEV